MALRKTCRMHTCQSHLGKVTVHIVVACQKAQVGICIAVVLSAACRGEHIGEQHTGDMVLAGEGVVVVEMAVPRDSLAI